MAIKLELDGATITFDTVEEYNGFAAAQASITEDGILADEVTTQKDERVPEGFTLVSFEDAKEGDYFLALKEGLDIKAGEKYELFKDAWNDLAFKDEEGGNRDCIGVRVKAKEGVIVRKIAAESTAPKDEIKIGDRVEIIGNTDGKVTHFLAIGDVGEVIGIDSADCCVKVDGREQFVSKQDVKKVDATAKEDPKKETQFKVGDIVTGNETNSYGLTNKHALMEVVDTAANFGRDLRVRRIKNSNGRILDDSTVYNVESKHFVKTTEEEFDAKHGITKHEETGKEAKKDALKVGDIVTGNELSKRYTITTDEALMRVESVSVSGDAMRVEVIKHVSRPKYDWHDYDVSTICFVKTTEEEFDAKHGITKTEETDKETNKDVPEGYEKVPFADAKEGDYFLALVRDVDIEAGKKYELREDYDGDLEFVDDAEDERMLENRYEDEDGIVIRKIVEEEETDNSTKIEVGVVVRTKRKYTDEFGDSIKEDRLAVVHSLSGGGGLFVKQRSDKTSVFVPEEDVESTLELVAKAIK